MSASKGCSALSLACSTGSRALWSLLRATASISSTPLSAAAAAPLAPLPLLLVARLPSTALQSPALATNKSSSRTSATSAQAPVRAQLPKPRSKALFTWCSHSRSSRRKVRVRAAVIWSVLLAKECVSSACSTDVSRFCANSAACQPPWPSAERMRSGQRKISKVRAQFGAVPSVKF
eukprot:4768-Heterococcus_DN1.PRE.1